MQHVAGLAALRALHVVHLRNDDTCVWVMRETKRFLIDNVSHYPDLPLEWIAIDEDDVEITNLETRLRTDEVRAAGLRVRAAARARQIYQASDTSTLSDLFSAFFGDDLFGVGARRASRGADAGAEIAIELVEAARGVTRDVPFEVAVA